MYCIHKNLFIFAKGEAAADNREFISVDLLGLFDVRVFSIAAERLCVSQTLMLLLLESEKRDGPWQCCASVPGLLGSERAVE